MQVCVQEIKGKRWLCTVQPNVLSSKAEISTIMEPEHMTAYSKQILARLMDHLVANAFYSFDEFMECRWDN
ncbi:hypothetical protein J6590_051630 [Homalodisca vitripennis]|nr:hypothetical protein J6590_051630 [Homalodisca vitripennis]